MRRILSSVIGKTVRKAALLRGGSGSALPGLIVEKIDPTFTPQILASLPYGTVLVSGTNGKTTTTKMVVELLESQGLKVFTNRTGSNFTRGVAAALLGETSLSGKLDADIAILELDEAYAVHFVRAIKPTYALLLNVMRDQLDRFGEIDATAKMLRTVAAYTTKGLVINRDDPHFTDSAFIDGLTTPIRTYSVHPDLIKLFPSDAALRGNSEAKVSKLQYDNTQLESVTDQSARISYGGLTHNITLQLKGIYNIQNAVGAIALTRMIVGERLDEPAMLEALANVQPAFGRGETVTVGNTECQLVLVKNPSGFRLGLYSFESKNCDTMIAINDNYADGRDMSWLWDVDFTSLAPKVSIVTGERAYDMALRLQYDEVDIEKVEPNLLLALDQFLKQNPDQPKRIYCTYTAMLKLRKALEKYTKMERIT